MAPASTPPIPAGQILTGQILTGSGAASPGMIAEITAALDWWREAGVDQAYQDAPTSWLSPSRPVAEEAARERHELRAAPTSPDPGGAPPAAAAPPPGLAHGLPRDLAAFTAWWLSEPALDGGRAAGRVAPRGTEAPALMVVVAEPEADDHERLLSGPEGRLLDAMLAAAGIAPGEVYVASAIPRHTPSPDWQALATLGLGRVLAHHVALVRPTRLMAFGTGVLSLLGHDPPLSAAVVREFTHEGSTTPLLGARSLSALKGMPGWKAAWWRTWLQWTR